MTFLEFRDAATELVAMIPGKCCTSVETEYWRYADGSEKLYYSVYVDLLNESAKAETANECLAILDRLIAEHGRNAVECRVEALGELDVQPKPRSIIWFSNGVAAVCDQHGQQIPKYQQGDHAETRRLLEADGIDWHTLECSGYPQLEQPSVAHSPSDSKEVNSV